MYYDLLFIVFIEYLFLHPNSPSFQLPLLQKCKLLTGRVFISLVFDVTQVPETGL